MYIYEITNPEVNPNFRPEGGNFDFRIDFWREDIISRY